MKKKKTIILFLVLLIVLATIIFFTYKFTENNNTTIKTSNKSNKVSSNEEIDFSNYETVDVTLKESYNITKGAVYNLTGTIQNGLITIETNDNVKLILNNVTINNENGPCIYVKNAKNVVIETKENTSNTLTDGNNYDGYDDDVKGCIFSKDDLYLTGKGSLNINANYEDGIVSKDDLVINSGTISVTSKDDGIRGKDSLTINGGNVTVNSKGKGLKVTNEKDEKKGSLVINGGEVNVTSEDDTINSSNTVTINGGSLTLSSGDDGIHADNKLTINGGTINVKESYEGLESKEIEINNGEVSIKASDDGINAASKTSKDVKITINGGKIYVNAQGDGVDSNKDIYINGGEIIVDGPENDGDGALDYDGECIVKGGEILMLGSSGMSEAPGNSSTQNSVLINLTTSYGSGSSVEIKDSENNTLVSYSANKKYQSILYSSSKLEKGKTYTVYINGTSVSNFTVSDVVTSVGNRSRNMGEMNDRGGMMGGPMEDRRR